MTQILEHVKTCSTCKQTKSIEDFHRNKTRKSGRSNECKECVLARSRKKYWSDPQKARERSRTWAKQNPEKTKDSTNNWKKEHKEYLAEYDKQYRIDRDDLSEKARIRTKNWVKDNPDRAKASKRASSHKRKLSIKGQTVTTKDIENLIKSSNDICYWCGIKLNGKFHLDHVIPVSKGGKHIIENLVISCPTCNLRKSNKLPEQFLAKVINV